jgi:hypothetical protein
MYCPQCGKKFWFRSTFCPDCRVGLVKHAPIATAPAEPATPEATPADTDLHLTRIFASSNPVLIALAQSLLDSDGIESITQGDEMKGLGVDAGPVEFWVRGDEADRARQILQDVREESQQAPTEPERTNPEVTETEDEP